MLKVARVLGALLGFAVVCYALGCLRPGIPGGFPQQLALYRAHAPWFYLHIGGGSVALLLTPFQLWPRIRQRFPRYHRIAGRAAATAIVLGSIGGLVMARIAYGGPANVAGFGTLAILWATTTVLAVRAIRAGDVARHRRWAIRSASLTFAAVTLRVWFGVLAPLVGFEPAHAVLGWLSWVPNLLVAEWWLRSTPVRQAAAVQHHRVVRQRQGRRDPGPPALGVGGDAGGER